MWQKLKKFIKKMRHPFGHWKIASSSPCFTAPMAGFYRVKTPAGEALYKFESGKTYCLHGNRTDEPCEPCDIEANRSGAI